MAPTKGVAVASLVVLVAVLFLTAVDAQQEAAPLSIGGDRLVFKGRRASVTWRAATTVATVAAAPLSSPDEEAAAADPAPTVKSANSTLALRFGRLAEVDAMGEVVRRVPSLARLVPSDVQTGTQLGINGTLDSVRFAYNGTVLALPPCPAPSLASTPDELIAAATAASAQAEAAAGAAVAVTLLTPPANAKKPVALSYANETAVLQPGGLKWSLDVQGWPFCAPGNRLALDVVMRSGGSFDAAPRVFDAGANASLSAVEVSLGEGGYLGAGIRSGLLGGAGDGDNDDVDGMEGAGGAALPPPVALAAVGDDGEEPACTAALRALLNATSGDAAAAVGSAAWLLPSEITDAAESMSASALSAPPSSIVRRLLRRALLAVGEEGVAASAAAAVAATPKKSKGCRPNFDCAAQADNLRLRQASSAGAALAAAAAEAEAEAEASAAAGAAAAAARNNTLAPSPPPTPRAARRAAAALAAKRRRDAKAKAIAEANRLNATEAAAANRQKTDATAALTAAASAAAAAARLACATPADLLAANDALGMPRIRARPRGAWGQAWARAEEAAAAATSGCAVASAADVAGDVLCLPTGAAAAANAITLGNGNGRVKAKPPPRGRMATLLLSDGVAARLELPAFAVDGDPTDPLSPQLPVDVLFLPSAEDAAEAVTRYVFPQPVASAALAPAGGGGGGGAAGRLHYDPIASPEPASDAYSVAEIADASSMPVATLLVYDPYVTEADPEAQGAVVLSALNRRASSARSLLSSSSSSLVAAAAAAVIAFGFL